MLCSYCVVNIFHALQAFNSPVGGFACRTVYGDREATVQWWWTHFLWVDAYEKFRAVAGQGGHSVYVSDNTARIGVVPKFCVTQVSNMLNKRLRINAAGRGMSLTSAGGRKSMIWTGGVAKKMAPGRRSISGNFNRHGTTKQTKNLAKFSFCSRH